MNRYQGLWLEQARSDVEVLALLRRRGVAVCHQLHYLQMVTEKLSKTYFWRSSTFPSRSHAGLVKLLRAWGSVERGRRQRLADALLFGRFRNLRLWVHASLPLAYEMERLAPALAGDGPNPEYPWPTAAPQFAPATFEFDLWKQLTGTGRGRQFVQTIELAVERFEEFG